MESFESYFLSQYSDLEVRRKARLLAYFALISLVFTVIYFVLSFINGLVTVRINMLADAALFFIVLLFVRRGASLFVPQQLFIVACWVTCCWIAYVSGGLYSCMMAWFPIVPIMAMILTGRVWGLRWLLITLLSLVVFASLNYWGVPLPEYPVTSTALFVVPIVMGAPIIFLWLTLVFDKQAVELMATLEDSNRNLFHSESELKKSVSEMNAVQQALTARERDISNNKAKLEQFISSAMDMVKFEEIQSGIQERALEKIVMSAAKAMGVSRASIWQYENDPGQIKCLVLYSTVTQKAERGAVLFAKDFPSYFKYILGEGLVTATHARTDESTYEFTSSYLKPNDIHSLLDAPYFVHGEFKGVVCFENQAQIKPWSTSDQLFAKSVADIVGLAFVSAELKRAAQEVRDINATLEMRVRERTEQLLKQNKQLKDYAFINAHQLRAPLSRILGLVELVGTKKLSAEELDVSMQYLKTSAEELDAIVIRISSLLTENPS